MTRAPRSGDEAFAAVFGVTPKHAAAVRKRLGTGDGFAEMDQELRAEAALADLDAVRSVSSSDLDALAREEDPMAALSEVVDERAERILRGRIGASIRWGRTGDRTAATQPARDGLRAKFAKEIDPEGTMNPAEREYRVDHLMRAHMLRMSLKSAQARRARKLKGS